MKANIYRTSSARTWNAKRDFRSLNELIEFMEAVDCELIIHRCDVGFSEYNYDCLFEIEIYDTYRE